MERPYGSKREPWHGQSHDRSAAFHCTTPDMCEQRALHSYSWPRSSR